MKNDNDTFFPLSAVIGDDCKELSIDQQNRPNGPMARRLTTILPSEIKRFQVVSSLYR